jgi:hypothetical protein
LAEPGAPGAPGAPLPPAAPGVPGGPAGPAGPAAPASPSLPQPATITAIARNKIQGIVRNFSLIAFSFLLIKVLCYLLLKKSIKLLQVITINQFMQTFRIYCLILKVF